MGIASGPARAAILIGLGLTASAAVAHHSFSMFDGSRFVTLNGTVQKFQWTNPHGYLEIEAPQARGSRKYTLEMTSINMLSRAGWTSRTVKPGDKVTAIVAPLRDGQPGGLLLELTLPDGRKMDVPVPNPQNFRRGQ